MALTAGTGLRITNRRRRSAIFVLLAGVALASVGAVWQIAAADETPMFATPVAADDVVRPIERAPTTLGVEEDEPDRANIADTACEGSGSTDGECDVPPTTLVAPTSLVPETTVPRDPMDHVLLIGDSIALETHDPLREMLGGVSVSLEKITWWGIAPCDVLDAVAEHVADPNSVPADVVVILYTGNAGTPCMERAADVGSTEYFETYERDVAATIAVLEPWSADVWIPEGLPAAGAETEAIAAELARRLTSLPGVTGSIPHHDLFTDADGAYATHLSCVLPGEPCDEPVRVRALDGAHLGEDDIPYGRRRMAHAIVRLLRSEYPGT